MNIIYSNLLHREKDNLNITARDLNEFDDPLNNILLDVMFESLYQRIKNKYSPPDQ
jgi:ABC-type amino acid transport substrate-binding protein